MVFDLKSISILGSTGSIGKNALSVLSTLKNNFSVYGISCNTNILEFGVSKDGMSTELFLQYSQINNCNLFSIDIVDYQNKFDQKEWNFILGRDDDFDFIEKKIPNEFELILLDTVHEARHVEKILLNILHHKTV